MSRDIFLKFPAIFLPKFVDITYKTKSRVIYHWTTVVTTSSRILQYCWHPDSNLEFLQLQAHPNFGGIYRLPTGRDEFNVYMNYILVLLQNCMWWEWWEQCRSTVRMKAYKPTFRLKLFIWERINLIKHESNWCAILY
jgi:hypothetical protein